jgi:hypothetical protein
MAKKKKNRRPKTNGASHSADDQFANDVATLELRKDHTVHLQERDGNVALETSTTTTSKSQQGEVTENHTEVQQDNDTTTPLEPILSNEAALESESTLLETTPGGELLAPQMTPSEATPEPPPTAPTTFETTARDLPMSPTRLPSTPTLSLSTPFTCKMDPVVADRSPQPNNITPEPTLSDPTPFPCKIDPVLATTTPSPQSQPVIKPNESEDANLAKPNDTGDIVVDHDFHHDNPDPATHVYNGVKGVWAWGREHAILVSPFLKVTEGIANKVVGIVLHSSLQEVDENLVRPMFGGLDNHFLNPVIHTIVSTSLGVGHFIGKNVVSPLVSLPGIVGL